MPPKKKTIVGTDKKTGKKRVVQYSKKDAEVRQKILSKKKRIAILISGRLTSYDKHYQNIIDTFGDGYVIDFYAGISEEPINKKLLDGFLKLYKPKKWAYSNKPLLDIEWDKVKANKEMMNYKKNPMFMWRNRDNVRSLLQSNSRGRAALKIKYDWVISTRADVFYKEKLNYNDLDPDAINIPRLADYGGYQDKIAIAKEPLMLEYLDLYDNMKTYLIDKKRAVNPEPLLKYHIDKGKNIPVHRIDLKHNIFPKKSVADKAKVALTGQK